MKESGLGRENGVEAYHSCASRFPSFGPLPLLALTFAISDTQSKSTIVNVAPVEEMREKDDWFADGDGERRYG